MASGVPRSPSEWNVRGKENSTPQKSLAGYETESSLLGAKTQQSQKALLSHSQTNSATKKNKTLSPSWLFNAAMLSSPVDLSSLVTLSRDDPDAILQELGLLNKMVEKVLNADASKAAGKRVSKSTRLDLLLILANCCRYSEDEFATEHIRKVLGGVSTWFEAYLEQHEASPSRHGKLRSNPELHKAMLLLLARAYDYKLRTEDLLELTGGDRNLALESVLGILEDGEVEVTEVSQRAAPKDGQRGQWEQRVATIRHEKPLVLHMCQLLLGFTRADTYFSSLDEGFYFMEAGLELPEYTIEQFSVEMDSLLSLTVRSQVIEKLAVAINGGLFLTGRVLESEDHQAIIAVHGYLQNLYLYATEGTDDFRRYLLVDTLLVPQLVIPYLERCVYHAAVLTRRAAANREALADLDLVPGFGDVGNLVDEVSDLSLDYPDLSKGIEATLRTLVICSFRAPRTRLMFQLLHRFNPTASLLRMKSFVARNDYIFSLLLLLNVNMGAFDVSSGSAKKNTKNERPGRQHGSHEMDLGDDSEEESDVEDKDEDSEDEAVLTYVMLHEVYTCYQMMSEDGQRRVLRRVEMSGNLPVARDTPSYEVLLAMLWGDIANQLDHRSFGGCDDAQVSATVGVGSRNGAGYSNEEFTKAMQSPLSNPFSAAMKSFNDDDDIENSFQVQDEDDDDDDDDEMKRSMVDFGSETIAFKSARAEAKAAAEERVAKCRAEQSALDALSAEAREAGAVQQMRLMGMTGGMAGGVNPFGDTFVDGAKIQDGLLYDTDAALGDDDLDDLVAQDLAACQVELLQLEAEVRALQSGYDLQQGYGKGDDEDDWSDDEEDEEGACPRPPIAKEVLPIATSPSSSGDATLVKEFQESKEAPSNDATTVAEERHASRDAGEGDLSTADSAEKAADAKLGASNDVAGEEKGDASEPSARNEVNLDRRAKSKGKGKKKWSKRENHRDSNSSAKMSPFKAKESKARSLLGDLPSLERKVGEADIRNFMDLQLAVHRGKSSASNALSDRAFLQDGSKKGEAAFFSPSGRKVSKGIPSEFACAINGHLMKDPVRSAVSGHVFERATIYLWIETRGQVCPLTGKPLCIEDLTSDKQLKTQIMRHHIQRSFKNKDKSGAECKPKHPTTPVSKSSDIDILAEASRFLDESKAPADGPVASSSEQPSTAPNALEDDLYDF